MKFNEIPPFRVHYLTINGKYVTPNALPGYSSSVITGALTGTTATDPVVTQSQKELAINITVQSVSGTSPTLDVYLDVLDPIEPQNSNLVAGQNTPVASVDLDSSQITSAQSNMRAVIANGQLMVWQGNSATNLGAFNVPMRWQLRFVIGGLSPSFGIIATFEARP
jgi:hypothetical protein